MNEEIVAMYQEKANAEQHPEMAIMLIAHKNGIIKSRDLSVPEAICSQFTTLMLENPT